MSLNIESDKSLNISACRACLDTKSTNCVPLDDGIWLQLYEYCVDLAISTQDGPQILCDQCANKVKSYSEFKKQCHNSEEFWKSILSVKCYTEKCAPHPEVKSNYVESHKEKSYNDDEQIYPFDSPFETECTHNINDEKDNKISFKHEERENVKIMNDDFGATVKYKRLNVETDDFNVNVDSNFEKINIKEEESYNHSYIPDRELKRLYQCDKCQKVYQKRSWFNTHLKVCYDVKVKKFKPVPKLPKPNVFYCGLCDFSSPDCGSIKNHLDEHCIRNDLSCKICDYKGRDFADLETHRYLHHPKEVRQSLICHVCNKRCVTILSLQFHYRSVHLKKKGGLCTVCSKTFGTFKVWKNHERLHKVDKYVCDLCGKKFLYRHTIKAHLIDHSNIRGFICETCGKGFKRMSALKGHIKNIHTESQPVKCSHCNKMFKCQSNLEYHMKKVTREKTFVCEVCSKHFATERILKNHMFWHTGDRPFSCQLCGLKYKAKGQLNVHMRNHTGDLPYKCLQCEKCFATPKQAKRHQSVHTGVREHKCLYCDRTFHAKKLMMAHCTSHHKDMLGTKC